MSPSITNNSKDRHEYKMGIIGNCAYMAHVDHTANVVWQCWPQFDSSFIFGSLVGGDKGGHFSIRPEEKDYKSRQYYRENTNVLCTEFETPSGKFRVVDCAPRYKQFGRYAKPKFLVRKVERLEGAPKIKVACQPMGQYGAVKPELSMRSNHLKWLGLERPVRLYGDIPLNYIEDSKAFTLLEDAHFVLTWNQRVEAPVKETVEEQLTKTIDYWRQWVLHCAVGRLYQSEVIRSALTLKLHQFEDTGAIIASGTTSLPEAPGSTRNWDYRYCWLRDAYYTLMAFNNLGHFEELRSYSKFVQQIAVTTEGRYQPLYTIGGEAKIKEQQLGLEGYLGNQPVRVGNQAHEHIQNDVYGQILVSLLPLYTDKRFLKSDLQAPPREMIHDLLEKIENVMDEPDAGLWEFRNKAQRHSYTYLFHWAGAKAALKIGKEYGDDRLIKMAERVCKQSTDWLEKSYDKDRGVYTQAVESKNLDASLLKVVTMNYMDPNSEKAKKHVMALAEDLRANKSLLYRYKHQDDFGTPSTAFLICAFWYVESLACVGMIDEAIEGFEELLGYSNSLGLMSEDIDLETGGQWGNFPQTYSHVGLVNAAFRIANKLDRPLFL